MMNLVLLLSLCVVAAYGIQEGDYCTKNGIPGVCTNIKQCPDAREDIKNRIKPHLCDFTGLFPVVCCISSVTTTTTTNTTTTTSPQKGNCILPPYPDHGTYVTKDENSRPGQAHKTFAFNVTCRHGYILDGSPSVFCQDGWWSVQQMPKCIVRCHLTSHPSVEYNCLVTDGGVNGSRPCKEYEPHGTVVSPRCQTPNYYSPTALRYMHCIDGIWDHIAVCTPECGTVTPDGVELAVGGKPAKRGEVPWHAGIYTKTTQPSYTQICGGSLISTNIIISAAHCFWSNIEGQQPESNYAVAVGKIYRPWTETSETEQAQRSDVKKIHLPERFIGSNTNYQDDIAIVIVRVAFEFKTHIRPVCIDFDYNFDRRQLQPSNKGKVAGWGLTAENGKASQVLNVVELRYESVATCISELPDSFRDYFTSDKFCAGEKDAGVALCKGDSGGGLAFPETDKGKPRYYLRGVSSTGPHNENLCNINTYTLFTQVLKHERFIKQYWSNMN